MHESKNNSEKATIFVVDDDTSHLKAMSRLLGSEGYLVETFESAQELLQREEHLGYGCLLIDLRMPGDSGLELQAKLNRHDYTLPIIFMTGAGDTVSGVTAMKHGAVDFLEKPVENEILFSVIANAIERDRHARTLFQLRATATEKVATLTAREKEVMNCVVSGMRNKIIAYELHISEKTVKAHRGHIMHKLRADSIVDLVSIEHLTNGTK